MVQLVDGIKQAPQLKHLGLRNADNLLSVYPDLRATLALLKNVKHLTICKAAKHTCLFLESVKWPLVTAELIFAEESYYYGGWDEPDLLARMHPAALLRGAQNTLVRLDCESWNSCEYRFGNLTYPNVQSLSMCDIFLMTDKWVKTYPNVSQLSVFTPLLERLGSMDTDDEAGLRAARETNMRAFAHQCWPRLEEASLSCVAELYSLGLPCHIRTLKFSEVKWGLPFLPETMEYARPVVLELALYGRYLATFQTAVQQAANGLRDLEQLRITVRVHSDSIDTDLPRSLLQGVNGIKLLPKLRKLALRMQCELSYWWERRRIMTCTPDVEDSSLPADSELSLITFDRWTFCNELFSLAPPLETVGLIVDGMPQGMSRIDEQVQRTEIINA
ncbi:hypothetical protein C8Q74DRAFT_1374021 [Fomes fomentarius]|nr:hypothetical protein C8Q74DRAFT_1374021 [Fomes fomentarius]